MFYFQDVTIRDLKSTYIDDSPVIYANFATSDGFGVKVIYRKIDRDIHTLQSHLQKNISVDVQIDINVHRYIYDSPVIYANLATSDGFGVKVIYRKIDICRYSHIIGRESFIES